MIYILDRRSTNIVEYANDVGGSESCSASNLECKPSQDENFHFKGSILSESVFSPDSKSGLKKLTQPTGTPERTKNLLRSTYANFENRVGGYFHIAHFEANDALISKTSLSYRFEDVGENREHFRFFGVF